MVGVGVGSGVAVGLGVMVGIGLWGCDRAKDWGRGRVSGWGGLGLLLSLELLSLGFGVRFVVGFDVRIRAGVRVGVGVEVKVKVKVRVYSLVSSAKHHSPDFIQLPPGHRTCSFIGHLNFPRSIQPSCHFFGARNYSNTQAFTVLPGTHLLLGRESARVSKVPWLGA